MESVRKMNWEELKEYLKKIDAEQVVYLLECEWDRLQQEAFMQGYEYAITILKESLVKNNERTKC